MGEIRHHGSPDVFGEPFEEPQQIMHHFANNNLTSSAPHGVSDEHRTKLSFKTRARMGIIISVELKLFQGMNEHHNLR